MSDLTNKILDAIDIMANDKVSAVQFDKTVRATIVESVDPSVGKYKVKYQNSTFFAYANDLKSYSKGSAVYVVIPSSNFESHPYIVGTVRKLGADFIDVLTDDDRMSLKGSNVLTSLSSISFCSYKSHDKNTRTRELLSEGIVTTDSIGLDIYKEDSDYILVGADFQTKLPQAQRLGSGNYGLRLVCQYYNDKYKDSIKTTPSASSPPDLLIDRVYELDINKMVGQPYNLFNPTSQRAIFEIDAKNLYAIKSITAFCENFPEKDTGEYLEYKGRIHVDPQSGKEYFVRDKDGQRVITPSTKNRYYDTSKKMWYLYDTASSTFVSQSDIFISDFRVEFYEALSEEELEGISLRVTQPLGSYFLVDTATGVVKPDKLRLHADLRIKGKKVNYSEQKVHFYWFDKDVRVAYGHPSYSSYGGVGWRCLNEATGLGGFNPDLQDKDILSSQCPALVNTFKCVAVFENDNEVVQVDAQTIIINRAKPENEFSIVSSVGTSFAFNIGQTTLTLKQKGLDPTGNYRYYWGSGVDGQEIIWDGNEDSTYRLQDIKIENALHFVTYECTVYTQNGNKVGSASITLVNGGAIGEYKLVLKNGSRIFKYNENGVSPNSPSLDELDRITIEPIGFDIYNEKGQLIDFADDTQKTQMCEITWFWPGTKAPAVTSDESMIVKSSLTPTARNIEIINPLTNKGNKYWVIQNSATLPYNIENTYDLDKTENTIELEVVYKNQVLRASTNFTFTKDGEQGTNGTEYIMRIVPTNNDFKRIVIRNKVLQGQKADGSFVNAGNTPFKIQIWNGGLTAYKEYAASASSVTWSTIKADRNQSCGLTINENSGIISINGDLINNPQNITIKACLQTEELSEDTNKYFATYCIDTIINTDYYIDGGFKECTYQSDGKRSAFSKKPFVLKQNDGTIAIGTIKWSTGWDTTVDNNNAVIEPPALYLGENIDTYISCSLDDTVVAYRPISLHLNRHGLSAMNDWDGNSLKLNNQGSNYILAPQVGAGKRETDGSFTGITIGKAFDNGEKVGLLGYHQGQRSIFLDSKTGNAEFGKSGAGRIILGPTKRGIAPLGAIYSGNYYINDATTGYPSDLNGKGMLIDLAGSRIHFGSNNFEVNSNGHLTAVGGGKIGSWYITPQNFLANAKTVADATMYLNGAATGASPMIKANKFLVNANGSVDINDGNFTISTDGSLNVNNKFIIYASGAFRAGGTDWDSAPFRVNSEGVLRAQSGTVGGWTLGKNVLSGGTIFLDKAGVIGGGSGGTYSHKDSDGKNRTGLKWKIDNDGYGYFSDVLINNTDAGTTNRNIISIQKKGDASKKFSVDNNGKMTASDANVTGTVTANYGEIGGWTISPGSISSGDFSLNSNGTVQLGTGFTVNSTSVTKSDGTHTGGTGGGHFGGNLDSGAGSSILGDGIGNGGKSWENELLAANLTSGPKDCVSTNTTASVTIDGKSYSVNFNYATVTVRGVSGWDNYNAAWLGSKIKSSSV